jgi:hypothetical protein
MPTWAKVLLAIGCGAVLLLVVIGVGGYFFINSHKDEWIAGARKANDEGTAFAQGKNANDCIDESLARLRTSKGILGEARIRVFLKGCLEVAAPSPQMCEDVPPRSEIIKSATWALHECSQRGMSGSQPCSRVMQELQERCEKK